MHRDPSPQPHGADIDLTAPWFREQGYVFDNRFELISRLGEGGSALVFKAFHVGLQEYKAIKILSSTLDNDPIAVARFQREARLMAKMKHKNIVEICDAGVSSEGHRFIVMELLEGETLDEWCERRPIEARDKVFIRQLIDIAQGTIRGLRAAHEWGVIHRDIKPNNIFLHHENGVVIPKLLDFGIARRQRSDETRLTLDGDITGTTDYISPEQARGREPDKRSDIYAMGVVIYEALTDKVPYGDGGQEQVMSRAADSGYIVTPPSRLNPHVSKVLDQVVMKALERDPDTRFRSATAMSNALSSLQTARPHLNKAFGFDISFTEHPPPDKSSLWVLGIAALAALMVILLAGYSFLINLTSLPPHAVPLKTATMTPNESAALSSISMRAPATEHANSGERIPETAIPKVVLPMLPVSELPAKPPAASRSSLKERTSHSRSRIRFASISESEAALDTHTGMLLATSEDTETRSQVETLIEAGNRALAVLALDSAEAKFNDAATLDRQSAEAWFGLSRVSFERHKFAAAAAWIHTALNIRDSARYRIFKADILAASGETQAALSEWQSIVEDFATDDKAVTIAEKRLTELSQRDASLSVDTDSEGLKK